MTPDELYALISLCDPHEVLEPGADRYVDIDRIERDEAPRRHAWARRIANEFAGADQTKILFFTGVPGAGKSTELRRIAEKLRDPAGAALFPVLIDAGSRIDRNSPLSIVDLLFVILYETERAVLELEALDPDATGHESVMARLWHWLNGTSVELQKFDVGVDAGKLVFELSSNPSFRAAMRTHVASSLTEFVEKARAQMRGLTERVKRYDIRRDGRVATMIQASAGYPRELVAMLQEMLRQARDWGTPLSDKRFDAALGERAARYTRVISQADYPTLVHVHKTKDHLPPSEDQLQRFGVLLSNSVIMMYQNADDWADLNPALYRHPELSAQLG
ncbi:hypothetical protein [Enhygromyxa salina]|uniref:Uncharacterized protein n=1 Tax=Enhygromyxa salina TaxID=215803 RepID=A0A2S9YT33_9BACT|nr:hypothetical protein [Enhygromyxa salina]PRQ08248.1 hypothetical protein ENSA7_18700 [Enhygromyxa salina]